MHQIAADFQFLLEFEKGCLLDVRITVFVLVAFGVITHRLFQGLRDSDVVHDESTCLVLEHSVHPGNSLHEVVAAHRLVDVHGGK